MRRMRADVLATAILASTATTLLLFPMGADGSPVLVRGTLTSAAFRGQNGDLIHGGTLGALVMDHSTIGQMLLIQGFWFPEPVPSGVAEGPAAYRFQMSQNAPNPFNPRTTINFVVAGSSGRSDRVSLLVFDVQGRLVRTIVSGPLPAGPHAVIWDGRSDNGTALPSGIYYARLSTGSQTARKQLVLLK